MKTHVEQNWYVRSRGEVRGPFPAGLVSRYVLLGRIALSDEVSADRGQWNRVDQVPALIPAVMRAADACPADEAALAHLEAARRWADELRTPHKPNADDRHTSRWRTYLSVFGILLAVGAVPVLLPKPPGIAEPQCHAAPAPGVIWRDCLLAGSELANVDLAGAVLQSADLQGSLLRAANLSAADLSYANLSVAKLRGANLTGSRLLGTDLRGSDLSDANLRGADLSYADLSGAELGGADFGEARLDHAIWVDGLTCLPGSLGECRLGRR